MLQKACDPETFRNSSRALLARKILASWNSNDLWSCFRAYKEANLPENATDEDIVEILGLRDSQLLQLWEIFSVPTAIGDVVPRRELFTALAVFCGARFDDKIRFLLSVFDKSERGLLSCEDLLQLVTVTLQMIGKATGVVYKPKVVKEALIACFVPETPIGAMYLKTAADQRWTLNFIGLHELEVFCTPVMVKYEDMPIASHPSAKEPTKRQASPKKARKVEFQPVVQETRQESAPSEETEDKRQEQEQGQETAAETQKAEVVREAETDVCVDERWVPLCLTMENLVPKHAEKYQKALANALGTSLQRVAIHHIAPPFMYMAVGGPSGRGDKRTGESLAFLIHAQLQSKHSYIRSALPTAKLALNPTQEELDPESMQKLEERIQFLESTLSEQTQVSTDKESMIAELKEKLALHERSHAVPRIMLPPPAFPSPIVATQSTFSGRKWDTATTPAGGPVTDFDSAMTTPAYLATPKQVDAQSEAPELAYELEQVELQAEERERAVHRAHLDHAPTLSTLSVRSMETSRTQNTYTDHCAQMALNEIMGAL